MGNETIPIDEPNNVNFIIDSKFRRETNNFKLNRIITTEGSISGPVLLKKIDPGLKPEDFLGVVVSARMFAPGEGEAATVVGTISGVQTQTIGLMMVATCGGMELVELYYNPANGILSVGDYITEEPTDETPRVDDDRPVRDK